ncbi:hypothetical protein NMY22_g17587 [Coprinellus aureogranulatus]|nr:hypothetical protein NMY22_g17587 [Coprinellus aureogranulatus]
MHNPRIADQEDLDEMQKQWIAKALNDGKPQPEPLKVIEVDRFTFEFLYHLRADMWDDEEEFTKPTWTAVKLSEVKDAVDHWCDWYNAVVRKLGFPPEMPKVGDGYILARRAERASSSREKREIARDQAQRARIVVDL